MQAYGYEQPMVFTPQQIFDQQSANVVLDAMGQYAAVLKDDYEKARDDYKEYMKEYGAPDFQSSLDGANDAFYNETTGRIRKLINQYGIDGLLRSVEGRNLVSKTIANTDYAKLATIRQSAKNYEEFLANKAKLQAEDKFDDEFDKYADDYADPTNWDPNKLWTRKTPTQFRSLHDIAEKYFDNFKPISFLGMSDAKSDPGAQFRRIYGVENADIERAAEAAFGDMTRQEKAYWNAKMQSRAEDAMYVNLRNLSSRISEKEIRLKELKAGKKTGTKEYKDLQAEIDKMNNEKYHLNYVIFDKNSKERTQMLAQTREALLKEAFISSQIDHLQKTDQVDEGLITKYREAQANARAAADRALQRDIHNDNMRLQQAQLNDQTANTPSYSQGMLTAAVGASGVEIMQGEDGKAYAARLANTFKPGYAAPAIPAIASYIKQFSIGTVNKDNYLANPHANIMTLEQFNAQQGNGKSPVYMSSDDARDKIGTSGSNLQYTGNTRARYSGGVMRIFAEYADKHGNRYMSPTTIVSENVQTGFTMPDGRIGYGMQVHQHPNQQYPEMIINKVSGVKSDEQSMGMTTVPGYSFLYPVSTVEE